MVHEKAYFETVPAKLDKSALVEGCNRLQAYYMGLIFQKYMVQGLTAGSVKG